MTKEFSPDSSQANKVDKAPPPKGPPAPTNNLDGEKAATEKIKSQGMKVIEFGPEDKQVFAAAFKNVAEEWVKDIDKRGKPGTEVFRAFTEALAASR